MPNALLTGVSGLIAHQRMLDVVGNNLANMNTHGYKVKRTLFSDLLYETIRPAASSSSGGTGGVNPNQIGSGVRVSQISSKFGQGNLELTGGDFDFAIQGDGFFVVNDGQRDLYTRNGAFAIDRSGFLVDPTNGYRVRRFGTVGEGGNNLPPFQQAGDPFVRIPLGAIVAGRPTENLTVAGNLSSKLNKPQAEVLTTRSPLLDGGAAASLTTNLSDLDANSTPYATGDQIIISGRDQDGADVNRVFNVSATTTVGDLIAEINSAFNGATASLESSGNIVLTADSNGETNMTLRLRDASGDTGGGSSLFAQNYDFQETTPGSSGDTFEQGIVIYDEQGRGHDVNLTFKKIEDNTWEMTASMASSDGTVVDASVQQIVFDGSGLDVQVLGAGTGGPELSFQFNGIPAVQTVVLDFQGASGSNGLTQLATSSNLEPRQDGFAPGALASIALSSDGVVSGVATNGTVVPIAQLAVSVFRNRNGLNSIGSNYFEQSLNSGDAQIGAATAGSRGMTVGGQLEASNVDVALEFTNLIVAQRGFSANAKTITVADEVLQELTNIIR